MKQLEKNKEYKIFTISSFMAHTTINTFKLMDQDEKYLRVVLKNDKGNFERKQKLIPIIDNIIIIPLEQCILKADSETDNFMGNACFNFVNTPEEIKEQLKLNLNDKFDFNYNNINFVLNGEYIKYC